MGGSRQVDYYVSFATKNRTYTPTKPPAQQLPAGNSVYADGYVLSVGRSVAKDM
ncbi:hypothetical protein GCM10029976_075310 [Kribbella albertanoniae]